MFKSLMVTSFDFPLVATPFGRTDHSKFFVAPQTVSQPSFVSSILSNRNSPGFKSFASGKSGEFESHPAFTNQQGAFIERTLSDRKASTNEPYWIVPRSMDISVHSKWFPTRGFVGAWEDAAPWVFFPEIGNFCTKIQP